VLANSNTAELAFPEVRGQPGHLAVEALGLEVKTSSLIAAPPPGELRAPSSGVASGVSPSARIGSPRNPR
jgi:hypothetical protein